MFIIFTPELEFFATMNSNSSRQSPKLVSDDKFTPRSALISSSPGPFTFNFVSSLGSSAALPTFHWTVSLPPTVFQPDRSFPLKREIVLVLSAVSAAVAAIARAATAMGRKFKFILRRFAGTFLASHRRERKPALRSGVPEFILNTGVCSVILLAAK